MSTSIVRLPIARDLAIDLEGWVAEGETLGNFLDNLPCVIYECNRSLELKFISSNISKLIGFEAKELIGKRSLWDERIVVKDLSLVREKLDELKNLESVSLIHRLLDRRGLPVWVYHSLQAASGTEELFRGCLLRMDGEAADQGLSRSSVDLFLHKIGNHFQLLRLVINSLKKVLPESRETEVLNQTIDSAIELARSFSDYNQAPASWSAALDMTDILEAAAVRSQPDFLQKGVSFDPEIESSLHSVCVSGDPFLLELAISHVLQNALDSTSKGGKVTLSARAHSESGVIPVVKIRVLDSGCGIEAKNLDRILSPFFTTKDGRYGLGLSTADRFVTMHSGLMQVRSIVNEGTEVTIVLPAASLEGLSPK
ncbi:MAG TPA: ATP-binding protein [Candidatus Binatia bacterium]|nr:ATP-binding protein [Candidatus Binatia bacterium]